MGFLTFALGRWLPERTEMATGLQRAVGFSSGSSRIASGIGSAKGILARTGTLSV